LQPYHLVIFMQSMHCTARCKDGLAPSARGGGEEHVIFQWSLWGRDSNSNQWSIGIGSAWAKRQILPGIHHSTKIGLFYYWIDSTLQETSRFRILFAKDVISNDTFRGGKFDTLWNRRWPSSSMVSITRHRDWYISFDFRQPKQWFRGRTTFSPNTGFYHSVDSQSRSTFMLGWSSTQLS